MKNKIYQRISSILNIVAFVIITHGLFYFFDLRLWKDMNSDMITLVKIFLPISVFGFSGILFGLSYIIKNSNKK